MDEYFITWENGFSYMGRRIRLFLSSEGWTVNRTRADPFTLKDALVAVEFIRSSAKRVGCPDFEYRVNTK